MTIEADLATIAESRRARLEGAPTKEDAEPPLGERLALEVIRQQGVIERYRAEYRENCELVGYSDEEIMEEMAKLEAGDIEHG